MSRGRHQSKMGRSVHSIRRSVVKDAQSQFRRATLGRFAWIPEIQKQAPLILKMNAEVKEIQ